MGDVPPVLLVWQVEAEGDVATAFTLARILSNIPLSRGGPSSVVIFDIHALQVLCLSVPAIWRGPCTWYAWHVLACCAIRQHHRFSSIVCTQHATYLFTRTCNVQRFCKFRLFYVLSGAQERFYFGDGVLPLFESGIPLLVNRLRELPDHDNVCPYC